MKSQSKDIRSYFTALGVSKKAASAPAEAGEPKKNGRKKKKESFADDDEVEVVATTSSKSPKTKSNTKAIRYSDSEEEPVVETAKSSGKASKAASAAKVDEKKDKVQRRSPRKEVSTSNGKPQITVDLSSIFGNVPTRSKGKHDRESGKKKEEIVKTEPVDKQMKEKSSPQKNGDDTKTSKHKSKVEEASRESPYKPQKGHKRQRTPEADSDEVPAVKQSKTEFTSPHKSTEKLLASNKPSPKVVQESPKTAKIASTRPSPKVVPESPRTTKSDTDDGGVDSKKDDKKRQGYLKFLTRGGPKNLGAKEFPVGKPGCLEGKTFVLTGVLDSFERGDVEDVVVKYGGKCTTSISKKTSYLIVGSEAGDSKLKKARSLNIPEITEDGFLNILKESNPDQELFEASYVDDNADDMELDTEPPKSSTKPTKTATSKVATPVKTSPDKQATPEKKKIKDESRSRSSEKKKEKSKTPEKKNRNHADTEDENKAKSPKKNLNDAKFSSTAIVKPVAPVALTKPPTTSVVAIDPAETKMWVDKYRPQTLKQLVGQTGEASNAKKLLRWLQNWFNYHGKSDDKVKAAWPGLKDTEGRTFKAALLSGPPGVGKTTTAHLVCKELGYDYFEMNASDTRNQKGLRALLSDALSSQSLFYGKKNDPAQLARKHVVVMDEVDGMSGNEDRGGVQELLALIKTSRVPIICICNDRNEQKIRTLATYCFDLRFTKPRNEQLKGFVHSICFKEKLKLPQETMQRLIIGSDQDIRQILHQLQLYKESASTQSYDPKKDIRLTNWDVIRKVFSIQDHEKMTINDKMGLFFQDYNFGPLFVQENYLRCIPVHAQGNRKKTLDAIMKASESLVYGDITERAIRSTNHWSLLPVQSVFSSLLPGEYMEGHLGNVDFPQWFGKNSNRNKRARLLQQLHTHLHIHVSGSLDALNMDYAPYLRRMVVNTLAAGDVDEAADVMKSYDLIRDDLDTLQEIAIWPNMRDTFGNVDSKTKASFTRMVNKHTMVPYAMDAKITKSKGKGAADMIDVDEDGDGAYEASSSDEDVSKDANIKVKAKKTGTKKATEEKATSSKKSKGRK